MTQTAASSKSTLAWEPAQLAGWRVSFLGASVALDLFQIYFKSLEMAAWLFPPARDS